MNDGSIITVRGLVKTFDGCPAVDNIDLDVKEGEIFGFLGPNGAGKTTTMRMITTLLDSDSGEIVIDGVDVQSNPIAAKSKIGVIQQHLSLDNELTVRENIMQQALYYDIPRNKRSAVIDDIIRAVGIEGYLDRMIETLSGGWKKRASIACALVNKPKILFLDEPTVSLDITSRQMMWDIIRKLRASGTTVFLTTHYIEEADHLCDRVCIIDRGHIVVTDRPENLKQKIGKMTVENVNSDGVCERRFFESRESAKEYAATLGGESVIIRRTSLEDCYLSILAGSDSS